jgi:hypothetical protein
VQLSRTSTDTGEEAVSLPARFIVTTRYVNERVVGDGIGSRAVIESFPLFDMST